MDQDLLFHKFMHSGFDCIKKLLCDLSPVMHRTVETVTDIVTYTDLIDRITAANIKYGLSHHHAHAALIGLVADLFCCRNKLKHTVLLDFFVKLFQFAVNDHKHDRIVILMLMSLGDLAE